jgi:electron transport complex protein RnfB
MNARDEAGRLVEAIDALLPQTQCRKCGYDGCRPYAEAIARGAADVDQCPPGGNESAAAIVALLGVAPKAVDPRFGLPGAPGMAFIDEKQCIGCALCIQACPVDAIVGAPRLMHTVIATACTGCELCMPPCPVDCIAIQPGAERDAEGRRKAANEARRRFEARGKRIERRRNEAAQRIADRREARAERRKQDMIEKAMERARQRLARADKR